MQLSKALTAAPGSVATDPLAGSSCSPETPEVVFKAFMDQIIAAGKAVREYVHERAPMIVYEVDRRLSELIASEGFYKHGQLFVIKTASGDGKADAGQPASDHASGTGRADTVCSAPISPEAVAAAIDALKLEASLWLGDIMWRRWGDVSRERYPYNTAERLAALRALTLPQLEYLRVGGKEVPK